MDNTIYQKNLASLKQYFLPLYEKYFTSNTRAALPKDICVSVENTRSGTPTLLVNNNYVHSKYDPLKEAEKLVDAQISQGADDGAVFIFGFGLGYTAEAALKKMKKLNDKNCKIVVLEKYFGLFLTALETRPLTTLLSSGRVIFIFETEVIIAALEIVKNVRAVIINKVLIKLNTFFYDEASSIIKLWKDKDSINAATKNKFEKRWKKNLTLNKESIADANDVGELFDVYKQAVFLAAGGPGLDEIAPILYKLKEHCIIIAVDTALRFFNRNNIVPDFVVSVDAQYWNSRHLDNFNNNIMTSDINLICVPEIYPSVLRNNWKKIYMCASSFPGGADMSMPKRSVLAAGGSVATTAFDFARKISPDADIFIAGLDLGFPEFRTHFRGALFEERASSSATRFIPSETKSFHALRDGHPFFVPSLNGPNVLTDKRMSLYASWFTNALVGLKNVYTLSDKGVFIKGLKVCSVDKIMELPVIRKS